MTTTLISLRRARSMFPAALVFLLGIWGFSPGAQAQQCTMSTSPATISFGSISTARDARVGAELSEVRTSTTTVTCPANLGRIQCITVAGQRESCYVLHGGFSLRAYATLPTSSTVNDVWETGYPGVGIRVRSRTYDNRVLSNVSSGSFQSFLPNTGSRPDTYIAQFTYQLIKTGPVTGTGTMQVGRLFRLVSANGNTNVTSGTLSSVGLGDTTVTGRSCLVTTPSVDVPLPTISRSTLGNVGDTAGRTAFRIGINCQQDTNVQVHMTLTDATTPGNRTNLLSLTSGSTAQGVRLRITNPSGDAVRFGPDAATTLNTHQFLIGPSSTTDNIPFSVDYVATGEVQPGTVIGIATFTMSYQ